MFTVFASRIILITEQHLPVRKTKYKHIIHQDTKTETTRKNVTTFLLERFTQHFIEARGGQEATGAVFTFMLQIQSV